METTRREFLGGAAGVALAGVAGEAATPTNIEVLKKQLALLENIPWELIDTQAGRKRTWLGREYWANRLADWQLNDGKIECLAGAAGDQVRTVSLLTREMVAGQVMGGISM